MTKMNRLLTLVGIAGLLSFGGNRLAAQVAPGGGPPGFDPAQFQQRIQELLRERLQVTSDDEWKVIQPRLQKVMDARRDSMMGGMGMMMLFRGGGPGGPPPGDNQGGPRFGPQPSPAAVALQKAIDSNASNDALKAALDKYLASRKAKQAALVAAQEDLRTVVTPRQEAVLTLMGML